MKECVTHHHACDCREARFAKMELALKELGRTQGEIHPGWNDEYIRVRWVREICNAALGQQGGVR